MKKYISLFLCLIFAFNLASCDSLPKEIGNLFIKDYEYTEESKNDQNSDTTEKPSEENDKENSKEDEQENEQE